MGEVERVHGTYSSTFGHEFRHRVNAASKDKQRGSGGSSSEDPTTEEDVVELHEEASVEAAAVSARAVESEGIDYSA